MDKKIEAALEKYKALIERRVNYYLATGFMPTRRSVRENVTQGIQSQRKTLGQNRERHNGRINRTN